MAMTRVDSRAGAAMEPVSKNAQKRRVKAEKAALKKAEKAARAAAAARSACASTADAAAAAADGDSVAHLLDSEPLSGADKWLGGVLGSDGCVYGVPGHARSVLRIDPTTDTVQTVRGEDEALLEGRVEGAATEGVATEVEATVGVARAEG